MHTLPLGMTRHMMFATIWVIKDFITGFVMPTPSSDLSGQTRPQPDMDRSKPSQQTIFNAQDMSTIVNRICMRLHVIRCTCQGFDLTEYMCEEPRRVYDLINSGSHSMTSYLRAHEYMILSMLMPYVLVDLLQPEMEWLNNNFGDEQSSNVSDRIGYDPMTHMVKAWDMYVDFFCYLRQQVMTETQVCTLEVKGRELQEFLWIAFPFKSGQKKAWHFPKMHHLDTFHVTIRLFGMLEGMSTQPTEHSHVFYSKVLIGMTNGKDAFNQIMHMVVRGHVLRDIALLNTTSGNPLQDEYSRHKFSRSQMYAFPIDVLYNEPERVKRTMTSAIRGSSGTYSYAVPHERLSSFTGEHGERVWGGRHRGFLFLPHLLGVFLVTRRTRFNILLEGLEKVGDMVTPMYTCIHLVTYELNDVQAPRGVARSREGLCTSQQANTALRSVLGPTPSGRPPKNKTLAQHRYEFARENGQSGTIRMFNTLEFHHEAYADRSYRMRCHTTQTYHNKFPVVSLGYCIFWFDARGLIRTVLAELLQVCQTRNHTPRIRHKQSLQVWKGLSDHNMDWAARWPV